MAGSLPNQKAYIMAILGATEVPVQTGLLDDYSRYIEYCAGRTSAAFVYNQTLTRRRVEEFERWSGKRVTYNAINKTWGAEFTQYLANNKKGKRLSANTGNKHLKMLKMFLNHALQEGWTSSTLYKQIKLSEKREAFPVTLSEAEILELWKITEDQIINLHPKERNNILNSRDWFVLATQTGLRYSDWAPERIQIVSGAGGGKNFRLYQKKTVQPVEIPLSRLAERILARHGGIMPTPLKAGATLKHVSTLARMAGIRKSVTTHTARRTFATLNEKAGVPRAIIMRITGHKSEKDYLKYVGVTLSANADLLRSANPDWFDQAI